MTAGATAAARLAAGAVFLLLTTVVTVAGTVAGALLSVVWFARMLRRCGLRVRFGQAA